MKQGQCSQEQIVGILHQAQKGEQTIQALCREAGITETTFYPCCASATVLAQSVGRHHPCWHGYPVSEASRLKEPEKENARLIIDAQARRKRLLAERDLARDALQEYLQKK